MARLVKFTYNKKEYERLNALRPLFKDELFSEDVQDTIFAEKEKEYIAHLNRSKSQRERRQKEKEAKALGIPYKPKTKRKIIIENLNNQKNVNLNGGLLKKHKKPF